jgi:hypothetical protein
VKPDERQLAEGDVVQLSPDVGNPLFSCCMAVVREPKTFGAMVYVQMTGENGQPGGQAFYFAQWAEMEYVGQAAWMLKRGDDEEPE